MISKLRAAGFAAASLVAAFGTFYAGPSRAWEMNVTPVTSSYLDHAAALLDGGDLSVDTATEAAISAPPTALDHAAVPALAEPEPAAEPAPPAKRTLAELVAEYSTATTEDSEHECLAGAVYFESKGESLKGQLSVAEVVLNRARSGRFPSTICGVVKQRHQFSFIRGGRFPPIPRATAAWRKAVAIATIAREELADGPAQDALFFHATYVSPKWRGLKRVATVGNHIFYR
ncbi:MAG: cell wall hydrolase [Allosphingosinicella sp.]